MSALWGRKEWLVDRETRGEWEEMFPETTRKRSRNIQHGTSLCLSPKATMPFYLHYSPNPYSFASLRGSFLFLPSLLPVLSLFFNLNILKKRHVLSELRNKCSKFNWTNIMTVNFERFILLNPDYFVVKTTGLTMSIRHTFYRVYPNMALLYIALSLILLLTRTFPVACVNENFQDRATPLSFFLTSTNFPIVQKSTYYDKP